MHSSSNPCVLLDSVLPPLSRPNGFNSAADHVAKTIQKKTAKSEGEKLFASITVDCSRKFLLVPFRNPSDLTLSVDGNSQKSTAPIRHYAQIAVSQQRTWFTQLAVPNGQPFHPRPTENL
jgi:hypothetical protein